MHSGDHGLANLWAVGGKQAGAEKKDIKVNYYQLCPDCGWKLTGKFSTCPRCQENLRTEECPYCRGMIPAGLDHCPRCTADFL